MNRDTQRFAFKCSSVTVDGVERDVYKDPITDSGKKSKHGRLKLHLERGWKNDDINNERFITLPASDERADALLEVFRDGKLLVDQTLDQIRSNAAEHKYL